MITWAALLPVIVQHGLPFAQKLWTLAASGGAPTPEQWLELAALSAQTPRSQMLDAITRAGANPEDPRIKDLLALVP